MDMPMIGQGTWPLKDKECESVVAEALDVGMRLIDTAQMYENEAAVGAGIRASGVKREEIFLTTKLHQDRFASGNLRESVEASIEALGGPVDLLLIHWPPMGIETVAVIDALEALREAGLTKAIGVSNHTIAMMREAAARAPIATNQVEFHCLLDQSRLKAEADRLGITLTAYMPVARGKVFDLAPVRAAAERLGKTPAQVALRWIVQQGVCAIPMSTKRANMAANLAVLNFELPQEDMAAISACTARHERLCVPDAAPEWDPR